MLAPCSDCCAEDKGGQGGKGVEFAPPAPLDPNAQDQHYGGQNQDGSTQVVGEKADRARSTPLAERTDRKWVAVTAYQPIDTVTKTVEIPVVKTVETYVPKVVIEEKLVEVPKYVPEIVDKYVEVEEVHWVDKIVEVPQVQYKYKYVPKLEVRENRINRVVPEIKIQERLVEVAYYRDITYLDNNLVNEKITRISDGAIVLNQHKSKDELRLDQDPALPQYGGVQQAALLQPEDTAQDYDVLQHEIEDIEDNEDIEEIEDIEWGPMRQANMMQPNGNGDNQYLVDASGNTGMRENLPGGVGHWQNDNLTQDQLRTMAMQQAGQPMGGIPNVNINPQTGVIPGDDLQMGNQPRIEQVFVPRVVQNVEIKKEVPVNVDVPVPYMVPKPMIVPVEVPVLKFHDHYKPVAVRRRVIPRIRWTNEVYEVECIREKPYIHVQDVIKPVPCDVEIGISEWVDRAVPINPCELSQADIHAMWMRANADLAEEKKQEYGEAYPTVQHPAGTVFGEPGQSEQAHESSPLSGARQGDGQDDRAPIPLHPGHPLNLPYLQNQWMKQDTTKTHQMYSPEWFEAHQRALHGVTTQQPTQVQLTPEQAAQLQEQSAPYGNMQQQQHDQAMADQRQGMQEQQYAQDQQMQEQQMQDEQYGQDQQMHDQQMHEQQMQDGQQDGQQGGQYGQEGQYDESVNYEDTNQENQDNHLSREQSPEDTQQHTATLESSDHDNN